MNKDIKNIYMIGICGIAMGTLAGMLKSRGYNVAGSDKGAYPPMSIMLENWGITIDQGFDPAIMGNPDLVIIGNAISRGNAQAEHVLNSRLPYLSMAAALHEFFLKDCEVISISGTHGKTTTTSLLSHILESAGLDPSFLIGGVSINYGTNFKLGNGKYFVIEGDEYDSAFFEKIPKFIIYKPRHLILTSLEFDHADIYNSLDEIKLWFSRLVNIIPSMGNIIYSNEYSDLKKIADKSLSECFSFGPDGSDFNYEFIKYSGIYSELRINSNKNGRIDLQTELFGDFNYANIAAAISMSLKLGIDKSIIQKAVQSFKGVKRRQELIYESNAIKIYEDFAHHPTAIKFLLDEIKKKYPDSNLLAIYEPRSATSRRNIFQKELPESFASADNVFLMRPYNVDSIPEHEKINMQNVIAAIRQNGNAALFENVDEILKSLFNEINFSKNNVIVIMSNGGFDGIYNRIVEKAKKLEL